MEFINLVSRFKWEFSKSKVFLFNILDWNWIEFELIIIETSFCKRKSILHMEFKRLCRYSIYIIGRIQKFIASIYWFDFCEVPYFIEDDFGFTVNYVLNDINSLTQLKNKINFLNLINHWIMICDIKNQIGFLINH